MAETTMHRIPREIARTFLRFGVNQVLIGLLPSVANAFYNRVPLAALAFLDGHEIIQPPRRDLSWGVALPGGRKFRMDVTRDDFYSYNMAFWWRQSDPALKETISRLLQANQGSFIYIDVGSNIGATAVEALAMGIPVWMFEPNPSVNHFVNRMAELNGWHHYRVFECALSDRQGSDQTFYISRTSFLSSFDSVHASKDGYVTEVKVPVRRLDDFLPEIDPNSPPRLLKVDVEGHELAVLVGAQELLAAYRPALLVEVLPLGPRAAIFTFLAERGYRPYGIEGGLDLKCVVLHDAEEFRLFEGINFLFLSCGDKSAGAFADCLVH
jgi:FkbM family methyltransferase